MQSIVETQQTEESTASNALETDGAHGSPYRRVALVLGALTFGLYLRTLAPGLLAGDPGEFQFAAWKWGLAHPTGYPLYLIVGGLWQRLLALIGISPATALNALSALFGAVAVGLFYWLLTGWLEKIAWFVDERSVSQRLVQVVALFGALMLAANPTFWSQSLIAEVYSLQVLLFVGLWLAVPVGIGKRRREGAKDREELQLQKTEIQEQQVYGESVREGEGEGEGEGERESVGGWRLILLAFLAGLALTHHAMTLLFLPCIGVALIVTNRQLLRSWRVWIGGIVALLLPLLLYLYIPLRSGVNASPWYHQPLGTGQLDLYTNDWASFVQFISGRSISVGFRGVGDALGQLGFAWGQWVLHLSWGGLILALIGLVMLMRAAFDDERGNTLVARQVLLLTLPYAVIQQVFNLFYNIGDIYVYYIPLYLVGAVWAMFGVAGIVKGKAQGVDQRREYENENENEDSGRARVTGSGLRVGFAVLLLLLPLWLGRSFMPQVDQSDNVGTRLRWEEILAAGPAEDAILISNDRNEIVPLFYTQFVEGRGPNRTGLFPLIAPDGRFMDIGTTIETALATSPDRPIYLIKPMPGLEARFDLFERTPPLVEVRGSWKDAKPQHSVDEQYGPLTLLGYDWNTSGKQQEIVLYWRVEEEITTDYTTTVQLFDAASQRVGQDDRPPGGVFYGTSQWKVGEQIVDRHLLDSSGSATNMLVGMYHGPAFEMLATPLEIRLHLTTP